MTVFPRLRLCLGLLVLPLFGRAGSADVPMFHRDPQRTGWNAAEGTLRPGNVTPDSFGLIWQSEALDEVEGRPSRLYASPLFLERVQIATEVRKGEFSVVFAASSNGFVYAFNAAESAEVPAGTLLWKTELVRYTQQPSFDGVNVGVLSTPVIDVRTKTIYVTSCDPDRNWLVYALDLGTGRIRPRWPVILNEEVFSLPGMNGNEAPAGVPVDPVKIRPNKLSTQRGALNLSPDGNRLYVAFGESATGWIVAVDTHEAKVAASFASVASRRNYSGGIWGSGGPAVDEQGNIYIATGSNFGGFTPQTRDWTQSVLKLSDSTETGFTLAGTYTPFNHSITAINDIDLGSGGVLIVPSADSRRTATPDLIAFVGKQGNVYLVDRARMPGGLERRPEPGDDSASDLSLLPPGNQPQFGRRGPLNVFGPYTETTAAVDQARSRSIPAYFQGGDGTRYLFVTGTTKSTPSSRTAVPPCLARLKIVEIPGQPAYLEVDQFETTVVLENPGSPVITSNGSVGAIVWVLDQNAPRMTLLSGANAPKPILYAFDALTLKLLWKSLPGELFTSGKYNEPAIARGTVYVGTDRIQAFGLDKKAKAKREIFMAQLESAELAKPSPYEAGKALYNSGGACATCHLPNGQGVAGVFPPLAGSEWVSGSEGRLIRIVLNGMQGKVHVRNEVYSAASMPGFGQVTGSLFNWDDEMIALVLNYIRREWDSGEGRQAPRVITAELVGTIRKEVATHGLWTEEELLQIK